MGQSIRLTVFHTRLHMYYVQCILLICRTSIQLLFRVGVGSEHVSAAFARLGPSRAAFAQHVPIQTPVQSTTSAPASAAS